MNEKFCNIRQVSSFQQTGHGSESNMDVGPGMASAMSQLTCHIFSNLTEDPAHFNLFQTLFARQSNVWYGKNTITLPVPVLSAS